MKVSQLDGEQYKVGGLGVAEYPSPQQIGIDPVKASDKDQQSKYPVPFALQIILYDYFPSSFPLFQYALLYSGFCPFFNRYSDKNRWDSVVFIS